MTRVASCRRDIAHEVWIEPWDVTRAAPAGDDDLASQCLHNFFENHMDLTTIHCEQESLN
jgi:hypothetical protein